MKPDLSIIIPSIRTDGWKALVEQISVACGRYTFEVIFVGPEYNNDVDEFRNVKYARDFGSPNRCQQIGLLLAEGEYVTWMCDDFEDGPFNIDKFLDCLIDKDEDVVVIGNYYEADVIAVNNFSVKSCYGGGNGIHPDWQIFNVAFVKRSYLERFGGFDCKYQVTCLGHTDLAVRMQSRGCVIINDNINLGSVKHVPNVEGDHGPIHHAQIGHDQPLFYQSTQGLFPSVVHMSNWKKEEAVWQRRF